MARPVLLDLVRLPGLQKLSIDSRAISDLFATRGKIAEGTLALLAGYGSVYSWTGFHDPHLPSRLAEATGGTTRVYPFRDPQASEHTRDYYLRCAGLSPEASPLNAIRTDEAWLETFLRERSCAPGSLLVVHPGSGSRRKNWQGFGEMIRDWRHAGGGEIAVLAGPADDEAVSGLHAPILSSLSLPRVAALLANARGYVGNDSGISHLASAVGAAGVVLFGPSDPEVWAPGGRLRVCHAPHGCPSCGPEAFCTHRLAASIVLDHLHAALHEQPAPEERRR